MSLADDWESTPAQSSSLADEWDKLPANTQKSTPAYNGLGSTFQNFSAGAGKAIVDMGRGAKQLLDIPAQWLEKKFPGISEWSQSTIGLPSAKSSAEQTAADIAKSKELDKPLMNTGAGVVGNLAGNVAGMMLPLGAASKAAIPGANALLNPATYKAGATVGALQGLLQPTTAEESKTGNAVLGGLGGMAGTAAGNLIGRIVQPTPQLLSAAHQKAVNVLEDAGIPLDAAQRSGSAFLNKVRSALFDNPFTAGAQGELAGQQKAAFNKAVLGTIGEVAPAATPDVMNAASSRINGVFKDVLSKNNVQLDDAALGRIAAVQKAASVDEKKPIVEYANQIVRQINDDGSISGQTAYNITKDLNRAANSSDTTLSYHAKQLRSALMDAINNSLPEGDQQAFQQAREQFAKMKKIEGAIDTTTGDISPSKLSNIFAQKANRNISIYGRGDSDLVDLANAGKMLLPDRTPNSGTPTRALMQLAAPLAIGAGEGAYTGDWGGAAKTAAGLYAIPKVAQMAINNPAIASYLTTGMAQSPARDLLLTPQTNPAIGGTLKRIPISMMLSNQP